MCIRDSDGAHPYRIEAIVTRSVLRQEDALVFAFEPAAPGQMTTDTVRDDAGQAGQLPGCGRTGAVKTRLFRLVWRCFVDAIEPKHVKVDVEIE